MAWRGTDLNNLSRFCGCGNDGRSVQKEDRRLFILRQAGATGIKISKKQPVAAIIKPVEDFVNRLFSLDIVSHPFLLPSVGEGRDEGI